jgi:hypothetical protein
MPCVSPAMLLVVDVQAEAHSASSQLQGPGTQFCQLLALCCMLLCWQGTLGAAPVVVLLKLRKQRFSVSPDKLQTPAVHQQPVSNLQSTNSLLVSCNSRTTIGNMKVTHNLPREFWRCSGTISQLVHPVTLSVIAIGAACAPGWAPGTGGNRGRPLQLTPGDLCSTAVLPMHPDIQTQPNSAAPSPNPTNPRRGRAC